MVKHSNQYRSVNVDAVFVYLRKEVVAATLVHFNSVKLLRFDEIDQLSILCLRQMENLVVLVGTCLLQFLEDNDKLLYYPLIQNVFDLQFVL